MVLKRVYDAITIFLRHFDLNNNFSVFVRDINSGLLCIKNWHGDWQMQQEDDWSHASKLHSAPEKLSWNNFEISATSGVQIHDEFRIVYTIFSKLPNFSRKINSFVFLPFGRMHFLWFTRMRTIGPDHIGSAGKYEIEKGIILSGVTEWLARTVHLAGITFSTSSIRSFGAKEGVPM